MAIILTLAIGWLDYITGDELAFSIFYFAPIALTSWYSGRPLGAALSFFAAATWGAAEIIGGKNYSDALIGYWNIFVRLGVFFIINQLVGLVRKELLLTKELSQKDPLTGAVNRRYFTELAEAELARTQRYKRSVSLAYIDLDNFKTVNDSLGHETGDHLLKLVVDTLKENLRKPDVVARIGGDEFLILMPETDIEQSKVVIERLLERCRIGFKSQNYPVALSIGVAASNGGAAFTQLLKLADAQMYRSKSEGKDCANYTVASSGGVA